METFLKYNVPVIKGSIFRNAYTGIIALAVNLHTFSIIPVPSLKFLKRIIIMKNRKISFTKYNFLNGNVWFPVASRSLTFYVYKSIIKLRM